MAVLVAKPFEHPLRGMPLLSLASRGDVPPH
jgi:hypothetical protein